MGEWVSRLKWFERLQRLMRYENPLVLEVQNGCADAQ
jgi:hypothetical protein